ncbi:DUF3450 domain-containing protein [Vibrio sp. HN007]|uniref:DUF3450 domain-containing protein n=1 Tax=Vibrio iocasae TaxID=3098914 RepID=UPI0035D46625
MRIPTLIATTIAMSMQVQASSLDQSAQLEQSIISNAKNSQQVVTKSSDEAYELQSEIDALEAEIKGLETYETHLGKVIESQNNEIADLNLQLEEIAETRKSIVPLMYEMLEGLSEYVRQDMPIRHHARYERVEKLRELMTQASISDAEKFRRILEAYQIELDYVTKMGTYTGTIEIDGNKRQAEQLYLGHLSYIARSLDKQNYWVWDNTKQGWKALDSSVNTELDKAYLVATKMASPAILRLPLSQMEVSK